MAERFANQLEENENFLDGLWFSTEVHSCLRGQINSMCSGPAKFLMKYQRDHLIANNVQPAVPSCHYWFEDDAEKAVTINSERFIAIISKFYRALGQIKDVDRDSKWFQQDRAIPRITYTSLQWLELHFPGRIMSRTDDEWAPHSPDTNLPDFDSRVFLKDNVYQNNPRSIIDLKR